MRSAHPQKDRTMNTSRTPVTYRGLCLDFELFALPLLSIEDRMNRDIVQAAWTTFVSEVCQEYPQTRNLKRNKKRWIKDGFRYFS